MMAMTTAMPPISRHGRCLFLPFFSPPTSANRGEGAKEAFGLAIGRQHNAAWLTWSAGRKQELSKRSETAEIAHRRSDKKESLCLSDNLAA
jgi:hypothetical protein